MDFEFDKNLSISKTVVLDTKEVSGSDDFVFKFFIPNEFKNVVAIKSFTTCIDIPSTSSIASSNLDVIYIYLNDFDNTDIADISDSHSKPNIFSMIQHNYNNKVGTHIINSQDTIGTDDLRNDPNTYYANPLIHTISSFTVKLYKSDGTLFTKNDASRFVMKLAVYTSFGKKTIY